jgi:hypothetical protein
MTGETTMRTALWVGMLLSALIQTVYAQDDPNNHCDIPMAQTNRYCQCHYTPDSHNTSCQRWMNNHGQVCKETCQPCTCPPHHG